MISVDIRTIPYQKQRYPSLGDWLITKTSSGYKITILVSDMGDWKLESLVAVHELVEVLQCISDQITQAEVEAFDIAYERNRKKGDNSEPGDHPDAPYRVQHAIAESLERILAVHLGVVWNRYEEKVEKLFEKQKHPAEVQNQKRP